jgi:aminoglycoside phosphotransferase
MRRWESQWGRNRICSLIGTAARSVRIPNHHAGPFETEEEFNEYLLKPAWAGGFQIEAEYKQALDRAKKMEDMSHRIVFTHGDLAHHNIIVKGGRITGFLD